MRRRLILVLLVLLPCVGCDQLTKSMARAWLPGTPRMSFLADTVRIEYAENSGAFLSLLENAPTWIRMSVFVGVSLGAVVVLSVLLLLKRPLHSIDVVVYTLVLAGAVGNLIDRIALGGIVVDFLNLGIGPVLRTGIFNVADVALMVGAGMILIRAFQDPGPTSEPTAES